MSRISNDWPARRAIIAVASVSMALHAAARVAISAPPAAVAVNVPAIGKTVFVSDGGKTIALDQAIEAAAASERVAAYRQLRAEVGGTGKGQLQIAQWCRQQKMADEERLHWQIVLSIWPGQPDAVKALGLRSFEGQLLTKEQIEAARKDAKLMREARRKWTPKLKRIKSTLDGDDEAARQAALDELDATRDPQALRLMEEMFADNSTGAAMLLVEMYGRDAKQQSTDALVRLAIHAKDAAVREKAAGELRYRPKETYMPALVGALVAPIEMSMRRDVEVGTPGFESYNGYVYTGRIVVGLYGVVRLRSSYTNRDVLFWVPEVKRFSGALFTGYRPDRHQVEYVLSCDSPDPDVPYQFHGGFEAITPGGPNGTEPASIERSIAALENRISELNEKTAEINLRVDAAIREATKGQLADDHPPKVEKAADVRPRLWWDWWQQQLQLNNYFARGTEVWTQLGIQPIEDVIVGDRVLTKNLDTGKLSFNLVIGIDQQHDAEVHAVDIGGRTIVATTDQPFFVPDQRWRRAQDLKPGTVIESLVGKARVESARPGAADETYSLLVEGNANYFVDRQGILVHDATRQ